MVRSIQSSVSSEGMMEETTYFVNGQIVGYSRQSPMGLWSTGKGYRLYRYRYRYRYRHRHTSSRIEFYDADHNRVGESSTDGMGGYNLKLEVKSKVDVDLDGDGTVDFGASASSIKEYFVNLEKSGYMMALRSSGI